MNKQEWLHGKWKLMYKEYHSLDATNIDLSDLRDVVAGDNGFYADPIVWGNNVFLESFDYVKGSLAVLDIVSNKLSSVYIGVNSHLSYPFVFSYKGQIHMIPESCHLNKINLYVSVDFPTRWEFKKTLIDNIHSGDNTIFFHDNKWWLFCMVYRNGRNNFCIFYAEDIMGEWREHKKHNVNVVLQNDDRTRSAGSVFVDICGRVIRPAQYSRRGINGEGVILYHIKELTETSYCEEAINLIMPDMINPDLRATHTFSYRDGWMFLDGRNERQTDGVFIPYEKQIEINKINNDINRTGV